MKPHSSRLQRQLGNTLTGLIIGLVIGLGIAVAVALLITKTSTPFTNKGLKTDKADQPSVQLQDPNKPLYGKDTAHDIAKVAPETAPAAAAVPHAAAKPDELTANQLANSQAVKATEPKVAAPAAKPPAAAPTAEVSDDKYTYSLQAGAFKEQADAESARGKLALLGFEAKVTEKTSDTGTMYRVRIGPFGSVETMNRTRSRLSENGVDVAVVRTVK
ncbi:MULTISPECIES: SPOR domain-containing protein [unclassified Undibacterium]|uniref:SPOR domain-containing protein n=1 Tax=unclassified Undibacterium TaxID=2630295 RepID=UPI002AC8F5AC|nr:MULTISPECIES: SPOR domain-containing protein [unclassified Undibacterium]MEB0138960.1 SPOR domain-containing protein [Undibacterium sp. CCC2.1]MEB0171709.1 SPOR domain-containing protein [Undibacterium sp. CCC1.1]MEB0175591.1 SPOR domain-containing protein [Undibacterium sp. CCC3.4]MEB0214911.1 SPOR domain-containing protein [Undibacterium sp. 5I2]WPX44896.1 SPOR domain-containing protein [Undibacterium sp. CCC3.4]